MKSIFDGNLPRNITASIIEGDKGEYIITYGDNIIFDKKDAGRFPDEGEILLLIKNV